MVKLIKYLVVFSMSSVVICLATLFLLSPQKTTPFVNDRGEELVNSIAEIRSFEINGIDQRVLIRGVDLSNPLLLHVHGGPGGADQAIVRSTGKTIEDLFTVVYWDQRGAGATYTSNTEPNSLSLKQIVDDGVMLSELLKNEFGKQKIFLQGHSWGTLVGVHMAVKAPHLYHAYFGIGQIANSKRAELFSYNYALNAANKAGDIETIDGLIKIGSPPYSEDQIWVDTVMVQRGLMQPYEMPGQEPLFSMVDIYTDFIFYPEYSVSDKLGSLIGSKVSLQKLWIEAVNADLFVSHPSLEIPLYFFQGKHDMHTVTEVAQDYAEFVEAPHKEYISFDESAHWPHINEYEKYRSELERVLKKATGEIH